MNIKRCQIGAFSAKVTLGLEIGYTQKIIEKSSVINFIQNYQDKLVKEKEIFLSVSVSECLVVLCGQKEPHLKLSFINYPKFPLPEAILRTEIENMTMALMSEFEQNRAVIEYLNETVMFENSLMIDPRIKQSNNSKLK